MSRDAADAAAGAGRWRQLALDFRWDAGADLALFVPGPNAAAVAAVQAAARPAWSPLHLTGPAATGKSHLLQAACGVVSAAGGTAVYVDLGARIDGPPEQLEGLEQLGLVALDGLDALAGRPAWAEAVFHCHNRLREVGGQLLVASRGAPGELGTGLADLVSRLQAMLRLRLEPPDDATRQVILQRHAQRLGLVLPEASVRYLLSREPRDLHHLLAVLRRLDAASLQAGRRLTVPFVREVLARAPRASGLPPAPDR